MLRLYDNSVSESRACGEMPVHTVAIAADAAVEDTRIASFLDAIIAQLTPLPAEFHGEVRRELRFHLESLIAAHEELGATREEAAAAAMRQFGDSRQIAQRYRQAWRQTETYERPWATMRLALAAFSLGMLATCAAMGLGARILYVGNQMGLQIGQITECIFLIALLGVPFCVGAWVGVRSPRRASFGTFCVLSALTVVSMALWFLFGLQTTGDQNPLIWLFHQFCSTIGPFFVFWFPMGWLGASIASVVQTRRSRRQRGLG